MCLFLEGVNPDQAEHKLIYFGFGLWNGSILPPLPIPFPPLPPPEVTLVVSQQSLSDNSPKFHIDD